MITLTLDDSDLGPLMFILANAEGKGINWSMVNPLLMKIGAQARAQQQALNSLQQEAERRVPVPLQEGNGQEVRHG